MRLVLKSYSQDVDIQNPEAASYLLTFLEEESGFEVRLPVQQETVLKLVQETVRLGTKQPTKETEEEEAVVPDVELSKPAEHPQGADIFGDEEYDDEEDGVESV
jgi:hypothetical protein